jgi:hypothetical protein
MRNVVTGFWLQAILMRISFLEMSFSPKLQVKNLLMIIIPRKKIKNYPPTGNGQFPIRTNLKPRLSL